MRHFAQPIFEMGQSSVNEKIDPKSYLPGRDAVTNAVKDLSDNLRQKLARDMQKGLLRLGDAFTVDEAHLKLQGRHYYDFTLHFMEIIEHGTYRDASFKN